MLRRFWANLLSFCLSFLSVISWSETQTADRNISGSCDLEDQLCECIQQTCFHPTSALDLFGETHKKVVIYKFFACLFYTVLFFLFLKMSLSPCDFNATFLKKHTERLWGNSLIVVCVDQLLIVLRGATRRLDKNTLQRRVRHPLSSYVAPRALPLFFFFFFFLFRRRRRWQSPHTEGHTLPVDLALPPDPVVLFEP